VSRFEWIAEHRRLVLWLAVAAAVVLGFVLWRIDLQGPPAAFEDRTPEVACGSIEAATEEEAVAGPEVQCLEDAVRSGGDAELVVRTSTAEGDPVVLYYRTVPGGSGLDLFIDGSQNPQHSGLNWTHLSCPEATGPNDLGECRNTDDYN
jgi:hypothetical protein